MLRHKARPWRHSSNQFRFCRGKRGWWTIWCQNGTGHLKIATLEAGCHGDKNIPIPLCQQKKKKLGIIFNCIWFKLYIIFLLIINFFRSHGSKIPDEFFFFSYLISILKLFWFFKLTWLNKVWLCCPRTAARCRTWRLWRHNHLFLTQ